MQIMPNRPHENQCNMTNQGSDTIVEKLKSYCMLYMIGFCFIEYRKTTEHINSRHI